MAFKWFCKTFRPGCYNVYKSGRSGLLRRYLYNHFQLLAIIHTPNILSTTKEEICKNVPLRPKKECSGGQVGEENDKSGRIDKGRELNEDSGTREECNGIWKET